MTTSPLKSTALVIDDELQMRRLLRVCLEANGYRVAEAATGKEGIAEAAQHPPDVVILDLGLPDMEGVAVLQRLREWSRVPVVVLSVRDREQDKIAALDNGADDYVTKPFSSGELLARLRVAQRHAALEQLERTIERQVAAFQLLDDFFELVERGFERCGWLRAGRLIRHEAHSNRGLGEETGGAEGSVLCAFLCRFVGFGEEGWNGRVLVSGWVRELWMRHLCIFVQFLAFWRCGSARDNRSLRSS